MTTVAVAGSAVAGPVCGRTDLVGRAEELDAACAAVRRGGCVIAGAAGVGKSRLAQEAATRSGGQVLRVLATASAATIPFGAFGHLLPEGDGTSGAVIPALIAALRARHGDESPTMVLDDAHLLDHGSAALALALAVTGAARLVVTVRSSEPVPDAVSALWMDHGLDLLELQPLGHADTRRLVALLLGAAVEYAAQERIYELTQGNPLYVRELVRAASRTGALHRVRGRWRWREDLIVFERLRSLVEHRTRELSDDARHGLELLALGAPLRLDVLHELVAPAVVEELERAGLAAVEGVGGATEIRMAHPLYTEAVAARLPATTSLRLRRSLARALGAMPQQDDDDRLRVAVWRLDGGETDASLSVHASGLAAARGAADLALRLARAAGDGLDAAVATGAALNALVRYDESEAVLGAYEAAARGADATVSGPYLEARFMALLRGTGAGPEALLSRAASWHTGHGWDALIATQRGWVELYAARPTAALRLVEPLLDDPALAPLRRFHLLVMATRARGRLGLTDRCLALAAELKVVAAELDQAPWETRFAQHLFELIPCVDAARDLCSVDDRLRAARDQGSTLGDHLLRTASTGGLGLVALRRGHVAAAAGFLEEAADALATADPVDSELAARSALVSAYALAGDAAAAAGALERVESLAVAQPRLARRLALELEQARALADAASGHTSKAIRRLLAAALAGHEHPRLEAECLYAALRLGADPAIVETQLRARAAIVEMDAVPLYADHAAALARRDPAGLLDVARAFSALGLDLYAAEAACAAAGIHHHDGREASSRQAASLARRHAAACAGAVIPGIAMFPKAVALTPREREIAGLAARGLSNREIAEDLTISVRTVESCVLRACRKTGAKGRHGLGELLDVDSPKEP